MVWCKRGPFSILLVNKPGEQVSLNCGALQEQRNEKQKIEVNVTEPQTPN